MGEKLREGPYSQENEQIWRSQNQICWSKLINLETNIISRLAKGED